MYIDKGSTFLHSHIPQYVYFICESKIIFKGVHISTSPPVENQYSTTDIAGINAGDNFEKAFHTKQKTVEEMKKTAEDIMFNFYKQTNPSTADDNILAYVKRFQENIDAMQPNLKELLPAEKVTSYYNAYISTLSYFTDLQNESIRKHGAMSIDGVMFGNNRVESFTLNKPFTAKLKTPKDPVAYLKDKKNKTSVPFPEKFSRKAYPNLTILEVEGVQPLIFKTGIVTIKELTFHDEVIGLRILDGDGFFHLYDARTKSFKIIEDAPKSSKVTTLSSTDNIYDTLTNHHYSLFTNATNAINKKITELHNQNKTAQFDWGDLGNTPFEVNKNGDIILDLDDWSNETDVVIFTAQDIKKFNTATKLGNAQSLVDILNKNAELLDSNFLEKKAKIDDIKAKKQAYDKSTAKPNAQFNKPNFLSNTSKEKLYKKNKITETANVNKKTTTLQYKSITFQFLNIKNKNKNSRSNNKQFINNSIKLLTDLGKTYTDTNNTINIVEKPINDGNTQLVITLGNNTFGTLLHSNKNPNYKKLNTNNKWENATIPYQRQLEKYINPFYTHLSGHKITTQKQKIEKKLSNNNVVTAPATAVEISVNRTDKTKRDMELQKMKTDLAANGIEVIIGDKNVSLSKGGLKAIFSKYYQDDEVENKHMLSDLKMSEEKLGKTMIEVINYFSKRYSINNPLIIDLTDIINNNLVITVGKYKYSTKKSKVEEMQKLEKSLEKTSEKYFKTLTDNQKELLQTDNKPEMKKMNLYLYSNNILYKKYINSVIITDSTNTIITDINQKILLNNTLNNAFADLMIISSAYAANDSKPIALAIVKQEMQDPTSTVLPSLGTKEEISVLPAQHDSLKQLFGNFTKFTQTIQHVKNGRAGGMTFADSIYIGSFTTNTEKNAILSNELVHAIIENQFPYFNAKTSQQWITEVENNLQVNEFLSDTASIQIDSITEFKRIKEWTEGNQYLTQSPNYKYTIEFFKKNLAILNNKFPNNTDLFYADKMKEIYMKKGKEFVKIIKQKEAECKKSEKV